MDGQISIFDFLDSKPAIGQIIYFITCFNVVRAKVVSQHSYVGDDYFVVKTIKGSEEWHIATYFTDINAAKDDIRKFTNMSINVV